MLSPENYIRQKARTLPIHECWINSDWDEGRMAYIIIARKHTNGNFTVGTYLVDLNCLGVKDAYHYFNISDVEYNEIISRTKSNQEIKLVSYPLVHNIIYAGIEFAEKYGFKPHKDYTSVTKYILEEDTEEIEFIDIECGENGKPSYIRGPFDNDARTGQIIRQLEKTAGKGNFDFILHEEDFSESDFFDEQFLNEASVIKEKKYGDLPFHKKIKLLRELIGKKDDLSSDEVYDLAYLISTAYKELIDYDKAERLYENQIEMIQEYEVTDEFSDELLGIEPDSNINREEWEDKFWKLFHLLFSNPKKALKKLHKLEKQMPDNPAIHFLIIKAKMADMSEDSFKLSEDYYNLHPDYPLLRMFRMTEEWIKSGIYQPTELYEQGTGLYFKNRDSLHEIELFFYIMSLLTFAFSSGSLEQLEMIDWINNDLELSEFIYEIISFSITQMKMNIILSYE